MKKILLSIKKVSLPVMMFALSVVVMDNGSFWFLGLPEAPDEILED